MVGATESAPLFSSVDMQLLVCRTERGAPCAPAHNVFPQTCDRELRSLCVGCLQVCSCLPSPPPPLPPLCAFAHVARSRFVPASSWTSRSSAAAARSEASGMGLIFRFGAAPHAYRQTHAPAPAAPVAPSQG